MAFPAFPTSPAPTIRMVIEHSPAIVTNKFGDQYEQQVADGINAADVQAAQLVWDGLSNEDKNVLEDFLLARKGAERFTYALPGYDFSFTWACSKWSKGLVISEPNRTIWSMSANFERKFDVL